MKNTHLTLRLPAELARALARLAREQEVPRSKVVREAVAAYMGAPAASSVGALVVTARDLLTRWPAVPKLDPADAEAFAADVEAARRDLPPASSPWE